MAGVLAPPDPVFPEAQHLKDVAFVYIAGARWEEGGVAGKGSEAGGVEGAKGRGKKGER